MLRVSLILLAWITFIGCGNEQAAKVSDKFMPDNNLWMEDSLDFASNISEELFGTIIDTAYALYAPIAEEWDEELDIQKLWSNGTVNADAWRNGYGSARIRMYGGMARRSEVIPIGFALVLCHELGHLYGGTPYVQASVKMAAEGQSDYYGAGWCLKNIAEKLYDPSEITITPYMKKVCGGDETCLRQLAGGQSLGILLSKLNGEAAPDFETPDPAIVKRTNVSYPKTTQCRLDSYHNGTLGKPRPLCWYKP